MKEQVLSINSFNEPTEYKNKNTIALHLMRLLLLEPGTNVTHPEMGVGLISKYRFSTSDNLDDLKEEIKKQITTYLPEYIVQTVDLVLKNKILYITIEINDDYYVFDLDGESQVLTVGQLNNG